MSSQRGAISVLAVTLLLLPACGGGGGNSQQNPPPNSNPSPSISSLSPSNANAGGNAFTLAVTGSSFIASSTVRWNGSDRTTIFGSSTQLQAAILATDIAIAGAAQVTVFNPSPGGGTSSPTTFTINNPGNPVPRVAAISPSAALAGGASFTLAVTGSNFVSLSVVRWNGSDLATTFVGSTRLQASVPASDVTSKGTAQVTVFTPPPGGGTSGVATFTTTAFGGFISVNLQSIPAPWIDAGPMASGNFNSDSPPDIAVTDLFPSAVHLGLGDGLLGFSFGLLNLAAINVVAADFNGDGHTDLAFTTLPLGTSLNEVTLFLGDGQGNFTQSWQYGYPLNSCRDQSAGQLGAISQADVNGDGNVDIVVGHTGFSVFLGNGDGTFAQPIEFGCTPGASTESTTIVADDFNRDGSVDLAVVDRLQSQLIVWLNDGFGNFSALPPLPSGGGVFGGSLVSTDFDLDGNPDLAAKAGPRMVLIYFGNGDGSFIGPLGIVSTVMDPNGFLEAVLSTADVNGDSIADLTVSGPSDQNQLPGTDTVVDVFLNRGNRIFSATGGAAFSGGVGGSTTFDLNGNGRADILFGGNGTLWELLN